MKNTNFLLGHVIFSIFHSVHASESHYSSARHLNYLSQILINTSFGWNKVLTTSFGTFVSVLYPAPLLVEACAKKSGQKGYATGWGAPIIVVCLSQVRSGYGVHGRAHTCCQVFSAFRITDFRWLN